MLSLNFLFKYIKVKGKSFYNPRNKQCFSAYLELEILVALYLSCKKIKFWQLIMLNITLFSHVLYILFKSIFQKRIFYTKDMFAFQINNNNCLPTKNITFFIINPISSTALYIQFPTNRNNSKPKWQELNFKGTPFQKNVTNKEQVKCGERYRRSKVGS